MIELKFKHFIYLLMVLLCSCSSDSEEEEVETSLIEGRHPEYYLQATFNHQNFKYLAYNLRAVDGEELRSEEEMLEHQPEASYDKEKNILTLKFKNYLQTPNHYIAWIEVMDSNKNELYEDFEKPEEKNDDLEITLESEEALEGRLRIRLYCQVHGEFTDYYDIPDDEKKNVLDLDIDTDPK